MVCNFSAYVVIEVDSEKPIAKISSLEGFQDSPIQDS